MQLEKFAKGGKIIVQEKDYLKFSKLGIVNKYEIEAINDIGLANVKFDKESVLKLVEDKFQELLDKYEEKLINEDSEIITKQIQYEIETLKTDGASLESIEEKEKNITDNEYRKKLIDEYRETQRDTAKTWVDYLKQSDYNTSFKYLILKAVLNFNYDLKQDKLFSRNEKTIRNITPFDASALAELYTKNSDFLLRDYINIQSENSLKVINSKDTIATNKNGRWIKFDGGEKTSESQININAQELSRLVQNTFWCTKSNASGQLQGGDFYVYVTTENNNVQPRIAVRMNENEVREVRGNRSDKQDLEDEMLPIAEDFLIKNIPNNSGVKWLNSIKYNEKALYLRKKIKEAEFLTEDIFAESNKIIAEKGKYNVDYGENGNVTLLISELKNKYENLPSSTENKKNKEYYEQIISAYKILNEIEPSLYNDNIIESYQVLIDLELDNNYNILTKEQVAFSVYDITLKTKYYIDFDNNVTFDTPFGIDKIETYSSLEYVYVSKLRLYFLPPKLTTIGGDAYFGDKITDLGNLTTIVSNADFGDSQVTNLGNLTTIGGDAYFGDSQVTNLGNLTTIGSNAYFRASQVTDLGNLTTIVSNADFGDSQVTNLGNLTTIGSNAYFGDSQVTNLGNLTTIGSNAYFGDKVTNLGNLTTIGGNADFRASQVTNLGNLTTIGGDAYFGDKVTDLGNLTTIGSNAYFGDSQVTNLGNLTTIGSNADFGDSQVTNLGNLTTIGGNAYFGDSQVTNLGNLTTIVGNADFGDKVTNLGNLTTIGGNAYFGDKVTDLGKVQEVGQIFLNNTNLYQKPNNLKTIKLVKFTDLPLLKKIEKIEKINILFIKQEEINRIFDFGGKEILKKIEIGEIVISNSDASAILNIFTEINSHVNISNCDSFDLTNVKKIKSLKITFTNIKNFSVEEITESFYFNQGNFEVGNLKKVGNLQILNTNNNYSLKNITEIGGDLIISSKALDLGKIEKIKGSFNSIIVVKNNEYLKYVGGSLNWSGNNLGVLEYVGESLTLNGNLISLNKLKYCKLLFLNGASIEDFGKLDNVQIEERFLSLHNLKTFGNVKKITSISEDFSVIIHENMYLESLGNLEFIGGQLTFGSKLRDTGNLKNVESLIVENNENIHFKSIERIEKHMNILNCKLNNFGSINYVGELNIESSEIESFDNLKECYSLYVKNSVINSFSTLSVINSYCVLSTSNVKSTGELSKIGGNLILQGTEINDFNLEIIEGNASFRGSNIVSANKLKTIKGDAWFGDSKLINMDSIKRILGSISYGDNQALKNKIEPILNKELIERGILKNGGNILLKKSNLTLHVDGGKVENKRDRERFDSGGNLNLMNMNNVEDLISKGIVELKMFDTRPEHAKEYGLDSKKPLYLKTLCVSENQRLKGIGYKVLQYIDDYAIKNGNDVVFGHITQKAEFSKDNRDTNLCDIDLIKSLLHKKGYDTRESNNDFHKVIDNNNYDINFSNGGETKNQEFKFDRKNVANEIYSSNKKKYGRFSTLRLAEINTDEILIVIISEDDNSKENLVYEKIHKRPANSMFFDNLIKRIKQKTEVEEKLRNAQSYRIYPINFNDKYTDEKVKKYFELKNLSELYDDYINEKKIEKEQNKTEKEKEYPIEEKLKKGDYYMIYFSTRGVKTKSKSYLKMRFDNLIISETSYLLSKNPIYYVFSTNATSHKIPYNELIEDFRNQNIMTIDDFEEKFGASNIQNNIENYIDVIEKERKNYDNNKDKFTRNRLSKNIEDLLSFVFKEPEYSDFEFTDSQKANVLIYCTKLYKNYFPSASLIAYIISSAKDFEYEYNSKISYWDVLKSNNLIKPYFVNSLKYKINPQNRELKKIFEDITSKDSLRPIMMGVNFVGNQAIGTDANKLVHVIGTKEGDFEDGVYPLNKKAIEYNGNDVISGNYPDWKRILPDDCTIRKSLSLPFIYAILENLKKNLVLSENTFAVQFILKDENNEEFQITFNYEILQDLFNSLLLAGLNHVDACFYSSSRYMVLIPRQEKIENNEDLYKMNFGLIMPYIIAETNEPIKIEIVNEDELNLTIGKTATKKLYKSDVFDYLQKKQKNTEENTKVYYEEIIDSYNNLLEIETDKDKKEYFKEIIDSYKNLVELI